MRFYVISTRILQRSRVLCTYIIIVQFLCRRRRQFNITSSVGNTISSRERTHTQNNGNFFYFFCKRNKYIRRTKSLSGKQVVIFKNYHRHYAPWIPPSRVYIRLRRNIGGVSKCQAFGGGEKKFDISKPRDIPKNKSTRNIDID